MEIPSLRRKLGFLIEQQYFDDWKALAAAFGKAYSTVYGWGHGRDGVGGDIMPDSSFSIFVQLLRQKFTHLESDLAAEELALSDVHEFERRIFMLSEPSWQQLIELEAISNCGTIILKPEKQTGLVVADTDPAQPIHNLSLHQRFRLEFSAQSRSKYVCVLQNAGQSWGGINASLDEHSKWINVPALKAEQKETFIYEPYQTGLHRFLVVQTPQLFPADFQRYLNENIELDASALKIMAHFYSEQPKTLRKLYLLEAMIE